MKKKVLKKKLKSKPASRNVTAPAVESAREIWLAGLGAFSVAQQESGRIIEQGSKLFDKLVAEGSKVEKKTRKDVENAMGDFRGEVETRVATMKEQADAVRKQATENWDRLEKIFEDRVARALAGLGFPSKEDVTKLADRVQKLSRDVAEIDSKLDAPKGKAPARKKTTGKKTARKKAAKKTARKAAAKKAPRKKAGRPAGGQAASTASAS